MCNKQNDLTRGNELANQHFYSTHLGRGEGVCKKSALYALAKNIMLKIMDGP